MPDPADLLALAERLAEAGGQAALRHFRGAGLGVDDKGGGEGAGTAGRFDPVTAADREAEAAMRAILALERPEDGILGEEQAAVAGRSGLTWVLDPVDGTRAFIAGLPTWGVLVGLDDGTRGRIGIIEQPFTGERFVGLVAAAGNGAGDGPSRAWLDRRGARTPLATRACAGLAPATLFTTDPTLFTAAEAERFAAVRGAARLTRYGVDCYAYALLALGHVDLVIEAGLAAYDIAAPAALVAAAGGVVTDWDGGDARWGGRVLAAGDARAHAAALALLSGLD